MAERRRCHPALEAVPERDCDGLAEGLSGRDAAVCGASASRPAASPPRLGQQQQGAGLSS